MNIYTWAHMTAYVSIYHISTQIHIHPNISTYQDIWHHIFKHISNIHANPHTSKYIHISAHMTPYISAHITYPHKSTYTPNVSTYQPIWHRIVFSTYHISTQIHTYSKHIQISAHMTPYSFHHISHIYAHPHISKYIHTSAHTRSGWQRPTVCLKLQVISAKEPLRTGLFCGKWPINLKHPLGFRRPVSTQFLPYCVFHIHICTHTHTYSHTCIHIINFLWCFGACTHISTYESKFLAKNSFGRKIRRHSAAAFSLQVPEKSDLDLNLLYILILETCMGWLHVVSSIKLYVSFAKKPYKRDDILQKGPMILRSLLIEVTPNARVLAAGLLRQGNVWITTDQLAGFHKNECDEMLCKLDSTENPPQFEIQGGEDP